MVNENGMGRVIEMRPVESANEREATPVESAPVREALTPAEATRRRFMHERGTTMLQVKMQILEAQHEQERLRAELETSQQEVTQHQTDLVALKKGFLGWFKHREAIQSHSFALAGITETVQQLNEKLAAAQRYE